MDENGTGAWQKIRSIEASAKEPQWIELPPQLKGEWIRLRANKDCMGATAWFLYAGEEKRCASNDPLFSGLATPDSKNALGGFLRTRGGGKKTLGMLSTNLTRNASERIGTYELDADLHLVRNDEADIKEELEAVTSIPRGVLENDAASAIYKDPKGRNWRLPRVDASFATRPDSRIAREVCTERDLFNCGGTFYELPAENAGGIAKVRPVATHGLEIQDFCSYRGLLVLTGIDGGEKNPHIMRSSDGQAAVWLGVADDLWKLGKPRGIGGPWMRSTIRGNTPSDAYLMTGFDHKRLDLSNDGSAEADFTLEADPTGEAHWAQVKRFNLKPGESVQHQFPDWFQASWVRLTSSKDTVATAQFTYE
jgi:hypothetical protein